MLIILSPTKKQKNIPQTYSYQGSAPATKDDAILINKVLKKLDSQSIIELMKVSEKLANDTIENIKKFGSNHENPAICAFEGSVFQSLNPSDFLQSDFAYAQQHFLILSGLYGYLRPWDLIQRYRLDVNMPLKVNGLTLYQYWSDKVTLAINTILKKEKTLINLASSEYFKVLNKKAIEGNIVTLDFKEYQSGQYKTVGTYAKKARGLMARFIIKNKLKNPDDIKKFNESGYKFDQDLSDDHLFVFVRIKNK